MTIDSAGKTALLETSAYLDSNSQTADFIERVRVNQQRLTAELKPHIDFIVCGSGRQLLSAGGYSRTDLRRDGIRGLSSRSDPHSWRETPAAAATTPTASSAPRKSSKRHPPEFGMTL
jgi:hypothetical protein